MINNNLKTILGKSRIFYAFKVSLAVFISYLVGERLSEYFSEVDPMIGGLWSAISAIFVLEEKHLETYKASMLRLLGSFIGSVTSAIFLAAMGSTLWALALCLFFTIVLCSIFKLYNYVKIANITVAIVIIVAQIQKPDNVITFALSRFLDSLIGIGVAIAVMHLFHKKHYRKDPL